MNNFRFKALAVTLLSLTSASIFAVNIPNTFTANTPAVASEVNANFAALSNGIDTNAANLQSVVTALDSAYRFSAIYYTSYNYGVTFGSSTSEVAIATCPAGSILVGGGVECRTDAFNSLTTNFGVVSNTIPAGNSIIGACYAEAITYSALKLGPAVTARAICLSPAIIPVQAGKLVSDSSDGAHRSLGQGAPSDEAQLAMEKIKAEAILRQTAIGQ